MSKRIVVKIGSSSLSDELGRLDLGALNGYVKQICDLTSDNTQEIILVSSGAVAAGIVPLGLTERPNQDDISMLQATSSVGQAALISEYTRAFAHYGRHAGQVLLTRKAIEGDDRRQNIINTINRLLELGCVPIVNENDTVATDELTFGDNDQLAALVASLVKADLLIIMSDVNGLYSLPPSNHDAVRIANVNKIEGLRKIESDISVDGSNSGVGSGGMSSKLKAVEIALSEGVNCHIIKASTPIIEALNGADVGTRFTA